MAKSLVIVESPAKAKTIHKFLGKDYVVKASMGHVRDLPENKFGVDEENDFAATYVILPGRQKVVKELKQAARDAESVYLALDPDREGEAISWHLAAILDGGKKTYHRVSFHEITKKAILEAFRNAGDIDRNKVNAQQARRILDRLVGYRISPLLWDKVRRGLSAGRVQSVALQIICNREREIQAFKAEEYWTLTANLSAAAPPAFDAKLTRQGEAKLELKNREDTDAVLRALEGAIWKVASVEAKEKKRNPPPPFITSKLQQEAARRLRFTVKRTMSLAQKLYEGIPIGEEGSVGLITYMRTDSTRIADEALRAVRDHIARQYGKEMLPHAPRHFAAKKGAQDAHEAIRPTSMSLPPEKVKPYLSDDLFKLYALIWNRFVASQMNPAVFDTTQVDVEAAGYTFRASGSVLRFPGYLAVYTEMPENGQNGAAPEGALPPLSAGEALRLNKLLPEQHFTQPPPRFSEATLVKELEENGIGRPSTYASILATLQNREYTVRKTGKFHPTELGFLVSDLLTENFGDIVQVGYTARMEEQLDEIEEGKLDYVRALQEFNEKFKKSLSRAEKEMRNVKREEIPTDEICEKCGAKMVIKWGRFGRFLACSGFPNCKNTKEINGENGNGTEAETTDEICPVCTSPMVVRKGRFGRFLACSKYPVCKTTRRLQVTTEGKLQAEEATVLDQACPKCGKNLVRKNGRFGAFIACSDYPTCKYIQKNETGVACPSPGCTGQILERRSKRGKLFYGCDRYPDCRFVLWHCPVPERCPDCGSPYLLKKKYRSTFKLVCPNEDCKYAKAVSE
jgi:DNA topoisomerase-1